MSHQPNASTAIRNARPRCVFCGQEHDTRFLLCPECTAFAAARTRIVQAVREEPDD